MKTTLNRQTMCGRKIGWFTVIGVTMFILLSQVAQAQPPSHDPSRMIRNTDGRYWIFTTGDGVWAMSSSNSSFTNWRVEPTVFPIGVWPSWINNFVNGFQGFFWAPDVVFMNNQYYMYYSCAGVGAPAAIGLATASNLAGPWTDRGMIVAGNNAIDPSVLIDGGNLWMTYGNWNSGIDLIQLNPSTGTRLNSNHWDLIPGEVEGPALIKNGSFYYLFFQRGLCCSGVNTAYYTQVGRSTSVTGPYVDKNGNTLLSGGGSTFLQNRDGRFIGPGHVGYGEGRLTYHFYDGNDNGAPKLRITTLSWSNGWPVADGAASPTDQPIANGTYRLQNRANGKYLDNLGATGDGANVAQWASSSSNNQRWVVTYSGGFYKLRCVTGSKNLDSIARTTNGSIVGQWSNGSSPNQQWSIVPVGSFFKVVNRANGKCVDTGGSNADGASMQHWYNGTSFNQQWTFQFVSSSTSAMAQMEAERLEYEDTLLSEAPKEESAELQLYPSPATNELAVVLPEFHAGEKVVKLLDGAGRVVLATTFVGSKCILNTGDTPAGMYILKVMSDKNLIAEQGVMIKR
ncbi:MAG TPA: family 43 glycosylhydrolase [Blastocatellia bacterium]|nr:family 43 glycosylhydrolase [Blastocatellia bacterium]